MSEMKAIREQMTETVKLLMLMRPFPLLKTALIITMLKEDTEKSLEILEKEAQNLNVLKLSAQGKVCFLLETCSMLVSDLCYRTYFIII